MDGTTFAICCLGIAVVLLAWRVVWLERDVAMLKRWRGVGGKVDDKR